MKLRWFGTSLVILMLSAGCSSVRVADHEGGLSYYEGAFEYATLDSTIKTHVVGSPFYKFGPAFAESVTATMTGATRGRKVTFISSPQNDARHEFHVVVIFNGKNSLTERDICESASPADTIRSLQTTKMFAVFCHGDHPLSYSSGLVDGVKADMEPLFHQLVKEVTLGMIPGYDDQRSSGINIFP